MTSGATSNLLDVVSHTPIETSCWAKRRRRSTGSMRRAKSFRPSEKLFSWWSYRAADWEASDRGRRLDHIWVTPALAPDVAAARILRDARGWAQASDHVPVMVDLA